jgi:hypothetical protein
MNPDDLFDDEDLLGDGSSDIAMPPVDSEALQALRSRRDEDVSSANLLQGLSGIGAALGSQGRVKADPAVFDAIRKAAGDRALEGGKDVALARKTASDAVRAKIAEDWKNKNYDQRERTNEIMAGRYENEQAYKKSRDAQSDAEKTAKKAEDEAQLTTSFGVANTPDDAKQIKASAESKDKLDRALRELIGLRKKYGAEVENQEAVSRAKKLSSDALLEVKNLANLGQISNTDMDIVRSIIRANPLEYDKAQLIGQDPVLKGMQGFQSDVRRDFQDRLKGRIRPGSLKMPVDFPRKVFNPATKQSATVSSEDEATAAEAKGFY